MTPLDKARAEIERLRGRTHELQERHDKEMSALRNELKATQRSRDFFKAIWWQTCLPKDGGWERSMWAAARVRPLVPRATALLDELFAEMDAALTTDEKG